MDEKPKDAFSELSEKEVRILAPDYSLKKVIAEDVDIKEIFSPENIDKAQAVINENKASFLEWVLQDIGQLHASYAKALASPADKEAETRKMARTAFIIKSQAGTFGFPLATRIAKSLDEFCSRHTQPTDDQLTVIHKHIEALVVIFNHNITGDGGDVGKDLSDNLVKLIDKYKDR